MYAELSQKQNERMAMWENVERLITLSELVEERDAFISEANYLVQTNQGWDVINLERYIDTLTQQINYLELTSHV